MPAMTAAAAAAATAGERGVLRWRWRWRVKAAVACQAAIGRARLAHIIINRLLSDALAHEILLLINWGATLVAF